MIHVNDVQLAGDQVSIAYNRHTAGGEQAERVRANDRPMPELPEAMDELYPVAVDTLDFLEGDSWKDAIKVNGIKLTEKKEKKYVRFSLSRITGFGPIQFEAPWIPVDDLLPTAGGIIERIKREAARYVRGYREQKTFEFESKPEGGE